MTASGMIAAEAETTELRRIRFSASMTNAALGQSPYSDADRLLEDVPDDQNRNSKNSKNYH
jgi:hypothetical protein